MSYKPLTYHLISFSLCLCCFLPCVHVSSFPKYQQQYSTLEKNKHDCANMFQIVKPLCSVLFSTSLYEAIDTLYELLLWETWAQGSSINSLRVHDLGHSLLSLEWPGLSDQRMLFLTENCRQWWKMSPYKGREVVCMPICAKKERNVPASVNQGYSTASQTATMCTACQH